MFTPNRKIKGEELHGMDIEELHKLEKDLEVGLSHVIETKARLSFYLCLPTLLWSVEIYVLSLNIRNLFWSFRVKNLWKRSLPFSKRSCSKP